MVMNNVLFNYLHGRGRAFWHERHFGGIVVDRRINCHKMCWMICDGMLENVIGTVMRIKWILMHGVCLIARACFLCGFCFEEGRRYHWRSKGRHYWLCRYCNWIRQIVYCWMIVDHMVVNCVVLNLVDIGMRLMWGPHWV